MKRKLLPLLGIAFVVALIATGVFYGLIVGKLRNFSSAPPQTSIVVAGRTLDPGSVIQKSDLKLSAWTAANLPKGAYTRLEQADGLTVVQAIQENEPLTQARVASNEA